MALKFNILGKSHQNLSHITYHQIHQRQCKHGTPVPTGSGYWHVSFKINSCCPVTQHDGPVRHRKMKGSRHDSHRHLFGWTVRWTWHTHRRKAIPIFRFAQGCCQVTPQIPARRHVTNGFLITFRSCDVCEVSYMHAEVSKSWYVSHQFAHKGRSTNLASQSLASWSTNPPLHSVHLAKDLSRFLDSPGQDEQPNWVKHSHTIIDQVSTFQHANPSFISLKQLYNEKPLTYNQISSTPSLPFATNAFFPFLVW